MVLYQPPKGHVDNEKTPTTPKLTIENAPLPTGVFFFVRVRRHHGQSPRVGSIPQPM